MTHYHRDFRDFTHSREVRTRPSPLFQLCRAWEQVEAKQKGAKKLEGEFFLERYKCTGIVDLIYSDMTISVVFLQVPEESLCMKLIQHMLTTRIHFSHLIIMLCEVSRFNAERSKS